MAGCVCKPGSGFQSAGEVTKTQGLGSRDAWGGGDSLATFGHGDVEIKFYIPSCFIVPFTGEQVQGYSNLPLLVKSHQNELHNQPV